MASSPPSSRLTPLQREALAAFFSRERGFYLTGGAALAGFHLGHRTTSDLDLFTRHDDAFERGPHVVADLAAAIGADLEVIQDAPGFRRIVLTRDEEALVIDLIRERSFQRHDRKAEIDGILVDPAAEILSNKLTALVGRAEERDLVDLMLLERAGHRIEDALEDALRKDGGCTPATLAWLLSEITIPDDVVLPAGVAPGALRDWLAALIVRLRRAAHPSG
jgi:hypothetical protein